jgi:hypothetical protein
MAGERRHERKHFFAGEVGKALEAAHALLWVVSRQEDRASQPAKMT